MPFYKLAKPFWDNVKLHQAGEVVEFANAADAPEGSVEVDESKVMDERTPQPEGDPTAGPRTGRRVDPEPATTDVPDDDPADDTDDGKPRRSATRRKK
jgi:hypothetical protein